MMGQRLMTVSEVNADRTVVDVSPLSAGNYLFRITTSQGAIIRNVIIDK